jgi:hypothetical protein
VERRKAHAKKNQAAGGLRGLARSFPASFLITDAWNAAC